MSEVGDANEPSNGESSNNSTLPEGTQGRQVDQPRLRVHRVAGDGNCMFRALAYSMTGDDSLHFQYRTAVMDYIEEHRDVLVVSYVPDLGRIPMKRLMNEV